MPGSPLSFHLVDRIVALEPARRAVGRLAVPAALADFPPCLVVEAIGQLAMWVAMQRTGFVKRPVATHAGEVRVRGDAPPGSELELEVSIRSCRNVAVAYDGAARVAGRTVVELERAVGAMIPMAELEDPAEAGARFDLLLGAGLPARRFPERAGFAPRVLALELDPGRRAVAEVEVTTASELYADHFPRRPVYPATLLLDAQIGMAIELVAAAARAPEPALRRLALSRVRGVKVRAFTPPGGRVTIVAEATGEVGAAPGGATEVAIGASTDGARVASAMLLIAERGD